jgi:hypothetical protein
MSTMKDVVQPPHGRNGRPRQIQILELQLILTFFDQILLNYNFIRNLY